MASPYRMMVKTFEVELVDLAAGPVTLSPMTACSRNFAASGLTHAIRQVVAPAA